MKLLENIDEIELNDRPVQDAVLIYFGAFRGLDEIHKLDMRLFDEIPPEIGSHDGHQVAMDDTHGTLFTYGNNAEEVFKAMQPILNDFDFLEGAEVHLQFNVGKKKPLELEFDFEKSK